MGVFYSENGRMTVTKENLEGENGSGEPNLNMQAWHSLGVPQIIIKALADSGFETPTPIQALTLAPAIMGRRDVLGAAETGSGKTLAFGIPIIAGILEAKRKEALSAPANVTKFSSKKNKRVKMSGEWIVTDENGAELCADSCNGKQCKFIQVSKHFALILSLNKMFDFFYYLFFQENNDVCMDSENEDSEEDSSDETYLDENGIGCVKVIDNVDFGEVREVSDKPLYALILTPTRELAIQIKNHLCKAAKYTDIRVRFSNL